MKFVSLTPLGYHVILFLTSCYWHLTSLIIFWWSSFDIEFLCIFSSAAGPYEYDCVCGEPNKCPMYSKQKKQNGNNFHIFSFNFLSAKKNLKSHTHIPNQLYQHWRNILWIHFLGISVQINMLLAFIYRFLLQIIFFFKFINIITIQKNMTWFCIFCLLWKLVLVAI